jgi:hypothetical protein
VFKPLSTFPQYCNGISEDVRKDRSTWENLNNKCICVTEIVVPCSLHCLTKTGVHGKKLLQKNIILYLVGPSASTYVSRLCARFRSVFAVWSNRDRTKNLDTASYYPELESKICVKRSDSNFSHQLDRTFSFKVSNSELKLHKCSKEVVEKVP